MRPGEEIRLVKENLAFAATFWRAASAGRVSPEPFRRPASGASQFSWDDAVTLKTVAELSAELSRGAANQMRAAFALSALQARRSLAAVFPGEPIEEELPELRAALSVMHLIGLAVRSSIIRPVWECPLPYRRLFQIRRLGLRLNATGLGGRTLSWDDFGGLDCYLLLLEYCAASADAARENGSEGGYVVLPAHLSILEYDGGVIGAPGVAPAAPTENLPASPPAGYSGRHTPSRPLPETPIVPDEPASSPATPPPAPRPASEPPAIPPSIPPHYGGDIGGDGSDPVDRFVAERCETGAGRRILAGELYAGFLEWRRNAGQEPISQRAFGMRLTRLGLVRKRRGHGKHWWEGIRLAG